MAGFGEASSCSSEGALELAGVRTGSVTFELQCSGKVCLGMDARQSVHGELR